MPDSSHSLARALGAVTDAAQLIDLANGAVERARAEVRGDASGVADRLSRQLQFLREVTEVLRHEIERLERQAGSLPLAAASESITQITAQEEPSSDGFTA